MNIIVMAMSTLNFKYEEDEKGNSKRILERSYYRNKKGEIKGGEREEEKEIEYYSQMEPACRKILEENPGDYRFLILATKATLKEQTFQCQDEILEISAVDFFLKRMGLKSDKEKKRAVVIRVEEDNFLPAISETINYIRKNWDEDHRLWINTQGGFRNISLVINAVISLLKLDKIEPSGVYYVSYTRGEKVHDIEDQSGTYKIFQFVSGIQELIRYGRADQLEEYYYDRGEMVPEEITEMRKIAEAIQMCDMPGFEEHLLKLRELAKNRTADPEDLLNIFWEQIRADYGVLLEGSYSGLDVVEWLYRKKFYQQAITYVESRIPKEWVEVKITDEKATAAEAAEKATIIAAEKAAEAAKAKAEEEKLAEEAAKAEDEARKASEKAVIEDEAVAAKESEKRILFFISSQKLQEVKDLLKKNYEEDENLLLSQFAYECVAWSDITTKKGIPVASFEDIDQLRKKGFVKKYKVQKETVGYGIYYKEKDGNFSRGIYDYNMKKERMEVMDVILNCDGEEEATRIRCFVLLYYLLKNERNKYNHMIQNKVRADQETLGKVLKMFLDIAKRLQ